MAIKEEKSKIIVTERPVACLDGTVRKGLSEAVVLKY